VSDGILYALLHVGAAMLGGVIGHYMPDGPSWSDIWRRVCALRAAQSRTEGLVDGD